MPRGPISETIGMTLRGMVQDISLDASTLAALAGIANASPIDSDGDGIGGGPGARAV